MKAISLWNPWAEAIRRKYKWIETRHWEPPAGIIGQRIAIHAAKKPITREIREDLSGYLCWRWLFGATMKIHALNYGGVVATAILEKVEPTELLLLFEDDIEGQIPYGDFSPGRFGWILRDIRETHFLPINGRQSFFDIPDHLIIEKEAA